MQAARCLCSGADLGTLQCDQRGSGRPDYRGARSESASLSCLASY